MFKRDSENMATARRVDVPARPWDDCFEGLGDIRLVWPHVVTVEVQHDCPVVVLYDPANAICVEPQSGPPDAVSISPDSAYLAAGGCLEHTVTWKWKFASRP